MTKIKENLKECLLLILLVFISILFILNNGSTTALSQGISLWSACVLPAIFPYLFITAILSKLSIISKMSNKLYPLSIRLFNTSGITIYAFIISLISGYPIGAKTISTLYQKGLISKTEVYRCFTFCSTPSPVFLMISVGDLMFNNRVFGELIFLSQLLTAFSLGCIFSFYKRKDKPKPQLFFSPKSDNILYESIFDSVISILIIGGLIAIFYLINYLLFFYKIVSPITYLFAKIFNNNYISNGLTSGLIEITCGLKVLSNYTGFWAVPLSSFICGFGGLCILFQQLAFLKATKIKTAAVIFIKLLSAVISFLFGIILSIIFI